MKLMTLYRSLYEGIGTYSPFVGSNGRAELSKLVDTSRLSAELFNKFKKSFGFPIYREKTLVSISNIYEKKTGGYTVNINFRVTDLDPSMDKTKAVKVLTAELNKFGLKVFGKEENTAIYHEITLFCLPKSSKLLDLPIEVPEVQKQKNAVPEDMPWNDLDIDPNQLDLDMHTYRNKKIYADWGEDVTGYVDTAVFSIPNFWRGGIVDLGPGDIELAGSRSEQYRTLLYNWYKKYIKDNQED